VPAPRKKGGKPSLPSLAQNGVHTAGEKSSDMHLSKAELISLQRARELFGSKTVGTFEVGAISGLKQIHRHLFEWLYEFVGQVREINIYKKQLQLCEFPLFAQSAARY
jgi:fido (protein-threonine AMPylation protein)